MTPHAAASVFAEAVTWSMATGAGSDGKGRLMAHAGARLGMVLPGAEAEVGRQRGGDGTAVDLREGWLQTAVSRSAKPWSLHVRMVVPGGNWDGAILSLGEGYRLWAGQADGQPVIGFALQTDFHRQPLSLTVPLERIGMAVWHDIVVRYSGPKLDLFVDGVLVDEEWPTGNVRQGPALELVVGGRPGSGAAGTGGAAGIRGLIANMAMWERAIEDDEVVWLAGGPQAVAQRTREILGEEKPIAAYWKPRGHNTGVGDCMPFYHDGRFHLFYLFDRRHHFSKWERGAHQWAHASTTDLVNWEHHPMAIPITHECEGSICTGSVFYWEGVYYAFYAARTMDGSPAPLHAAVSTDGIHFTKRPPLAWLDRPYQPGPARDPVIFRHPQTGQFHMLVTSELADSPVSQHGGCLAQLISDDLVHWRQAEPFIVPGYTGQPECPDYFHWNGWYYLIFSNHAVARYRMSRTPLGPWRRPSQDVFDGPQACVLKTAAFTGNRRLGVAFLNKQRYAGDVIFREIIQHLDGTLGTTFVPEMAMAAGRPLKLEWMALTGGVTARAGTGPGTDMGYVRIDAVEGFGVAGTGGVPRNVRITLRVRPAAGSSAFGLCLRGQGSYQDGYELRVEPSRQKVSWRHPHRNSIEEGEREAIYQVDGLDKPFTLEVIALEDILDVCVDGRRTLVIRAGRDVAGDQLSLFAHHGEVTFQQIAVRPLG